MIKLLLGWLSRNGTSILGWLFSSALFKFLLFFTHLFSDNRTITNIN